MKYRELGKTGLSVSEIGFGTWGLGGGPCSYGPVDDQESIETLKYAYQTGVNFFDTSDAYGNGHSEEIVGTALKDLRKKVIIASKVGCLPHSGREMPQDFSASHIRKSIETSLKRLQTDYLDLYQLHSPLLKDLENPEVLETLQALKKEGKIRAFGISVRSPQDGLIAIEKYGYESVQVNFNLIDQRAVESGLFDLAKKEKTGIIARTPFCFGFLTDKYSPDTTFDENDHRRNWPKAQIERWIESAKLFDSLCKSKGQSHAQLALKFCLAYDSVSTVIPGMMNIEQVKENTKSSDLTDLSPEDLAIIKKIYQAHDFFDPSLRRVSDKT